MHDYAIFGHDRAAIGRWLGVFAILISGGISQVFIISYSWTGLEAFTKATVATGVVYFILHWIFNNWVWKLPFFKIPNLAGTWNVKGKAQATLGFNFSKSYTIGHSGSRKVPSTHNGRKVKRAELKAYRLYDKHTFKVTWTSIHVKQPQYYGTYWAKKPSGYHYKMVYYYK